MKRWIVTMAVGIMSLWNAASARAQEKTGVDLQELSVQFQPNNRRVGVRFAIASRSWKWIQKYQVRPVLWFKLKDWPDWTTQEITRSSDTLWFSVNDPTVTSATVSVSSNNPGTQIGWMNIGGVQLAQAMVRAKSDVPTAQNPGFGAAARPAAPPPAAAKPSPTPFPTQNGNWSGDVNVVAACSLMASPEHRKQCLTSSNRARTNPGSGIGACTKLINAEDQVACVELIVDAVVPQGELVAACQENNAYSADVLSCVRSAQKMRGWGPSAIRACGALTYGKDRAVCVADVARASADPSNTIRTCIAKTAYGADQLACIRKGL